jgi:hypothetical protein
MSEESRSIPAESGGNGRGLDPPAAKEGEPYLEDPRIVLSLLEADQVVAAKKQSRFGLRKFSPGVRAMLWGLRIYVILMLIIVLFSVLRALQTGP